METRYFARLRFVVNGPVVEGKWALVSSARDRYTEWVGIYSKDPEVVVCLIGKTGDQGRALRMWTAQGESTP
ncbi:hypothetical protein ACIO93_36420 [Streptomyces sp. NPDC087903]|uniref:hypothetical protein n=1 Tax=Streptomyces sp. NPDC087903 TaxID=3365819 RepID=UPI003800E938